jgi:hypothetical protein
VAAFWNWNLPLFAAMTGEILPPLAALCHRQLPEFVAICRRLGAVSSQLNLHLLLTVEWLQWIILCVDDRNGTTKTRRQGVSQRLEPHFDFIHQQRQRRKTWQEIADLLFSEKGIRVTFYAPYRFYRRRLKRAAKPNWENSAGEIQPVNPAIQPPSRPAPLPKQNTFNRPNIKNINTDQEFT